MFGLVFAGFFGIVGLFPLLGDGAVRIWSLVVGAAFLAAALLVPHLLRPLNLVWFRFGLLLHKVTNPLIMGVIFFLVLTPTGLLMRLTGRDLLSLKLDRDASSYWVLRDPPGPAPESMERQF